MDYNILIGGSAGQGVDTVGTFVEKALKRMGYYVFSNKDYMSRIRGGHNFTLVRFSDNPLCAHKDDVDVIIALNEETVRVHREKLTPNGKVVCDVAFGKEDDKNLNLPLKEAAKNAGNPKVMGSAAVGATLKLFGIQTAKLEEFLNEVYDGEILAANLKAVEEGYKMVDTIFQTTPPPGEDKHILINGNEAVALGTVAAGCTFYSAYPMTPATGIMSYLAKLQEDANIVVEQAEDEIAAIIMALGASYGGVRAMTGSSGGGFALMVEAMGFAGIGEIPLVVAEVQRPGPATGLPTRTEQADLKFIINCSQGEFPLMVIAIRDVQDAFYQTTRAFNLAEKYQMPVVIVSDQYLADYYQTVEPFDFSKVTIDRQLAGEEAINSDGVYRRYSLTENGISPRIIPGKIENQLVFVDSDEHDEEGHITESAQVRVEMVNKRMKKLEELKKELQEPVKVGEEKGKTLLVAWGSTYGPLKEATERLVSEGISVTSLIFGDIWPLPEKEFIELAKTAEKIVNIEGNATGQLKDIIRQQTGVNCVQSILKYDGRAFSSQELYNRIKGEVL
ncbi:2-oxoacid:acceptor oxidoreductase subunit alpha [Alkalicella caledoniensis]|uniref:2-oxoacid:acceptor oxidoreductase subunit alpha n=1 Tax=Alkalicella caledoniensis TaxID=2731377 RepID=A0A7G9WA75_ALKCA|nr:2-oxoacid:acceptor oxidoreductase subunit alpha [Alkalicella caledoniensis]QNO15587.1 2-oxoacid:acceptor oxidoreductase subunit alpha [Alkalicella caledoniensis]